MSIFDNLICGCFWEVIRTTNLLEEFVNQAPFLTNLRSGLVSKTRYGLAIRLRADGWERYIPIYCDEELPTVGAMIPLSNMQLLEMECYAHGYKDGAKIKVKLNKPHVFRIKIIK